VDSLSSLLELLIISHTISVASLRMWVVLFLLLV
jgi:hypothetical protein